MRDVEGTVKVVVGVVGFRGDEDLRTVEQALDWRNDRDASLCGNSAHDGVAEDISLDPGIRPDDRKNRMPEMRLWDWRISWQDGFHHPERSVPGAGTLIAERSAPPLKQAPAV
jgi:hypothetical protein